MHTKKNAAFIIIVVLSMLILAYVSFITVYEQILSQNNGFFNAIIFGVVLILVFIFITLLARIVVVKPDNNDSSPVLRILIFIGVLAIFAIFVVLRLGYESSVYPDESDVFKTAVYICNGQLSEGGDVYDRLLNYPGDFVYGFILSIFFTFLEPTAETYLIVNLAMMIIVALFMYFTVNLIAGKAYAVVAVIIMLFMPNNTFLIYSYNSELFIAAVFMISFYLYELLIYRRFMSSAVPVVIALFCGFAGGFALSCEPVLYITFIVLTTWVFTARRQNAFVSFLPLIISIITMIGLSLLKASLMAVSFFDVLIGQLMCFVPVSFRDDGGNIGTFSELFKNLTDRLNNPSRFLNDNFYFLTNKDGVSFSANQAIWLKLADQLIYIFMLILCVLCIVYIIRVAYDKIMPALSVLVTVFIGQFLGGVNQVSYLYFVAVVFIVGSTTIYYMYLNHHPDYAVFVTNQEIKRDQNILLMTQGEYEEDDEDADSDSDSDDENEVLDDEYLRRAKALVFIGEDDSLYEHIKEEEKNDRINNSVAATRIKTTINEEGEYDSYEEKVEFFDELDEKVESKPIYDVKAIPATRPVEVVKPVLAQEYYYEEPYIQVDKPLSNSDEPVDYFDEPDNAIDVEKTVIDNNQNVEKEIKTDNYSISDSNTLLENDSLKDEEHLKENVVNSLNSENNSENNIETEEKENKPVEPEGFVFRKKDANASAASAVDDLRKQQAEKKNVEKSNPKKTVTDDKKDKKKLLKEEKLAAKEAKKVAAEEAKAAKLQEKLAKQEAKKQKKNPMSDSDDSKMRKRIKLEDVKPGEPLPNPLDLPKPHVSKKLDYDDFDE